MKNRLGKEARFKHVMEVAVFISVFCLKFERSLAHFIVSTALVELEIPVAFEIIWIFSEIPSCAEEKGPVDFSGGSQTMLSSKQ